MTRDILERLDRWPLDEFDGHLADDIRDAMAEIYTLRCNAIMASQTKVFNASAEMKLAVMCAQRSRELHKLNKAIQRRNRTIAGLRVRLAVLESELRDIASIGGKLGEAWSAGYARAALDAPPAAERPSGLHCDYAGASCLQGCATHGWCRRDPNPPTDYIHGSPFTRYADGAWWLPAAEESAARVSERGEGRGASTGLPDALASVGAVLVETQRPTPEWLADAERGFVGAVYGPTGEWKPTDPTIEAGDPA